MQILKGLWSQDRFSFDGDFYTIENTILEPKPVQPNGVPVYAGGGSEEGRSMIATHCDHYLMHGGTVDKLPATSRTCASAAPRRATTPTR